jgi:hypothetical protein
MKTLTKLLLLSPLFLPTAAIAQTYPTTPGWSWSGHVDHMTFDKEAAWEQGIADNATAVGFSVERFQNTTENTWSLGMNFIFYNDDDEFAEYVEDYWGYANYEESNASAISIFAEYGPRYRFGADRLSFFSVRGGVTGIIYSERGINDCRDCYSEDIDIDGGLYGLLGIGRTTGSIDWSLQFQQYLSGDIDNVIRLRISGTF